MFRVPDTSLILTKISILCTLKSIFLQEKEPETQDKNGEKEPKTQDENGEKEPETRDKNGEITIVQEGKSVVPRELIDLTKDDEPTLPRATFKCKSCFNEFDSSDDIIEHYLEKHVTVFEL